MESTNKSFCSFVKAIEAPEFVADEPYETIFEQYEKVILQALATSFGLDFLVHDRHGGDVDTIHNIEQIDKGSDMVYKNKRNEENYKNRGEYNSKDYHSGANFQRIKGEAKKNYQNNGFEPIKDEYTGEKNLEFFGHSKNAPSDKNAELDHTVEAKFIHDDRGRVLANLNGKQLADSEDNFSWSH